MAFISIFDVLGPEMIGPSSSHTAGACSIALLAGKMADSPITHVEFTLYQSFAKTHKGHGTDLALLGGIMGFSTDDRRIPLACSVAEERGLSYRFITDDTDSDTHPNTVDIRITCLNGRTYSVRGESLGGGKVRISRIDHIDVDFSGEYSTLIIIHRDRLGVLAHITRCLSEGYVNIAFMKMFRENVPGFENCYLDSINASIGVRESRRIKGIKMLDHHDAVAGKKPEDSIALCGYFIDIHNGAGAGTYRVTIEEPFGIPYGCLVSADIPNLMMAGRDISVDAITFGSTRIMNECMAVGQAAGEAAAMAIASHCEPEKVDVAELRRHLLEQKAILSV